MIARVYMGALVVLLGVGCVLEAVGLILMVACAATGSTQCLR